MIKVRLHWQTETESSAGIQVWFSKTGNYGRRCLHYLGDLCKKSLDMLCSCWKVAVSTSVSIHLTFQRLRRLLSSVCFIVHVLQVYSSYIMLNFRVCSGYLQEFLIAFNIVISIKPNALWSAQGCPPPKWNQFKPDFFLLFISYLCAECNLFDFLFYQATLTLFYDWAFYVVDFLITWKYEVKKKINVWNVLFHTVFAVNFRQEIGKNSV